MDAYSDVPVDVLGDDEFDAAFELLPRLVDLRRADELMPLGAGAVYTASVVLWLLVYQRMNKGATLAAAVKHLIESASAMCPDNKRIREGTLSKGTGGYTAGRNRLTREVAEWFAREVSDSIIATAPLTKVGPVTGERRVYVVDGSTLALAPEPALQAAFPPASNQHGEGVWPVALLTVTHELESGAATQPEVGAMYGPNAVSETELARACFAGLPAGSVVMGDANFGIFSVAQAADRSGKSFLFRLTPARFQSLRKRAALVNRGDGFQTWSLTWTPTSKDRQTNPQLPAEAAVNVLIHEVVVHENLTLWLVTSLPDPAPSVAALYGRRGHIETDISNIKLVLDTEHIRARSEAMFRKELLTSMVSYNLVVQFRRQAAELARVPPKRLSFTGVWTTYSTFLLPHHFADPTPWRTQYRKALHYAMRDKLPNRPGRNYKREAYPKRPKSNAFPKRTKPHKTG
jgi:Transposase DDE domain